MLGIIFEITCAPHVPYAVKGGSREGCTKSLTQKQLTRESSDGDLDGGEKDESVKELAQIGLDGAGNTARRNRSDAQWRAGSLTRPRIITA